MQADVLITIMAREKAVNQISMLLEVESQTEEQQHVHQLHQERMWLQPNEVSEDQISDTHIRRHNFAIDKGKIINTIKDHNNIKGFTVESKVPVKNLPGNFQSEYITCGSAEFKTIIEPNIDNFLFC